jgi:hypothetical protein
MAGTGSGLLSASTAALGLISYPWVVSSVG